MNSVEYLLSIILLFFIVGLFTFIWINLIDLLIEKRGNRKSNDSLDISHLVAKKKIEPMGRNIKHIPVSHSDADLYEREHSAYNK